jgi:hypothetical protein
MHLLYMPFRQTLIASILIVFLPQFCIGQAQKPEQELKNYLLQLKNSKVDTFLIIKAGCVGCEVKYSDTMKAVADGQTIYVLSQRLGQFEMALIDDFGRQRTYAIDSTSIFDMVKQYMSVLHQKNIYYKKMREKLSKGDFSPPRPIHYNYSNVTAKVGNFFYEYMLVENDSGMFVFPERNEKWYMATKTIIDNFFSLVKSVSH